MAYTVYHIKIQFEASGCSRKHKDCLALYTDSTIAFQKGGNIILGAQSKYEDDVVVFQNIKYADQSRFEHSTINDFAGMANENGVFDFSAPGKSCMIVGGVNIGSQTLPVDTDRVEDCLYAKILARKDAVVANDQRNVMTWIHGGTFNFGGIDVTYENPDNLVAENDIIVAKINYRLGEL